MSGRSKGAASSRASGGPGSGTGRSGWKPRSILLGGLLFFATSLPAQTPLPGDVDGDCDVDRNDLSLLLRDRNRPVDQSACGDACDLDGDGRITALDARRLVTLCTLPRCAVATSTCTPENRPPTADAGPDQTVALGTQVRLDGSGSTDPDGDLLAFRWEFVSRPAGSAAVLSDPSSVTPDFVVDAPGRYIVQLVVNDGSADSAPDRVRIDTLNSPPVADAGPDQTVDLGALVQLDGSGSSDVDGDPLTYSWRFVLLPSGSTASLSDAHLADPTFVADAPGTYELELRVNDGSADSAPDRVRITTRNSPPVADAGPDRTARTGQAVTLDGGGSHDADGDALSYAWSFTTRPAGSRAALDDPASVTPSFTPDRDGLYVLQLIVNDGQADSTPDTVRVETFPNRAPAIVSTPPTQATVGQPYTYAVQAQDPDAGDRLRFRLDNGPAGMAIDPASGVLSWTPAAAGGYGVRLSVVDAGGLSASQSYTLVVTAPNRPPEILPPGDRSLTLGQTLDMQVFATDPDPGDALHFALPVAPAGMTIDPASGRIAWTPTATGKATVTVKVVDTAGAAANATFSVQVAPSPPPDPGATNRPPELTPPTDQVIEEGGALSLRLNATDPDGDPLRFSLLNGPAGMTLAADGTLAWTAAVPGPHDVAIQVSDSGGLADSASFTVTVLAPNGPPQAGDDLFTARTGETLAVPAFGVLENDSDPDGDPLSARLVAGPERGRLTLRPDGGFEYTPAPLCGPDPVPVRGNLTERPGIAGVTASSHWPGREPGRAVDGDPDTSWLTNSGDTASAGATPYLEVTFAQDVSVSEVRLLGHREYPAGYGVTAGVLQLFDAAGALLHDSGPLALPAPDRDLAVPVPDVRGVRRVRFTVTADENPANVGLAELQVFGETRVAQCLLDMKLKYAREMSYIASLPVVADLNADGVPEIIYGDDPHLVILDGASGTPRVLQVYPGPTATSTAYGRALTFAVGDIDNDGRGEIVAVAWEPGRSGTDFQRKLMAFEHDGALKWVSEPITRPGPDDARIGGGAPQIADLDGDGVPEIIVGHGNANVSITVFENDGRKRFTATGSHRGAGGPGSLLVADIDLDGRPEIVFQNTAYRADGEVLWANDGYYRATAGQAVANLDDDPYGEIVGCDGSGLMVYEHDGTIKWYRNIGSCVVPIVADYDSDGFPEIGVGSRVYERDGTLLWEAPVQDFEYAPQVFDFDDDGINEAIIASSGGIWILDGRDGSTRRFFPSSDITLSARGFYPMVVDLDGDGHSELLLVNEPGWGRFRPHVLVYENTPDDWPATRPVFSNTNYTPAAIGLDMDIPDSLRPWWLIPGQNGFRTNPPLPEEQPRRHDRFTYKASDGTQDSNVATVHLEILPPNEPPRILSTPDTTATVGVPYLHAVVAVDPDAGDTLTFRLANGPAGMTLDPATGQIHWLPSAAGEFGVGIQVVDSQGQSDFQGFTLRVGAPVTVPDVTGLNRSDAEAALAAARLASGRHQEVHDPRIPAGVVISQTPPAGAVAEFGARVDLTVSLGPGPGDTDADGDGFTPNQGDCDDASAAVHPGAADAAGDGQDQNCDGVDGVLRIDRVRVEPEDAVLLVGQGLQAEATAILSDGGALTLTSLGAWSSSDPAVLQVDAQGRITALAAGTATLRIEYLGAVGAATVNVAAPVPADRTRPLARIATPAEGAEITAPLTVTGTASDDYLLRYELALAPAGSDLFTTLATGTAPVADGVLGRIDPTTLRNGLYTLRLRVFDRGGNLATHTRSLRLAGRMKVGDFSLSFTDLRLPMSGLPLTLIRSYDSRDKAKGDFGIGWRLGLRSFECRASGPAGEGWAVRKSGLAYLLVPTRNHELACTLPDGRVEAFRLEVTPDVSPLLPFPPYAHQARFVPLDGTLGRLEPLDNTHLTLLDPQPGPVHLLDDSRLAAYAPNRFRYTAADGTRIVFSLQGGVESITDPNGNTLTIDATGIHHSAGGSITFTRDGEGRITAITDPAGRVQRYEYDARGDLVAHTDAEGNTTRFRYDHRHGLIEILDPLGRPVARNDYDAAGRLVRITNADGRTIGFTHDPAARREVVTDADGGVTVLEYDDRGNLVRVTDPQGNVTTHTYDARGNRLSTTNAEGETTTWTYDDRGNRLTETDPLGHTTAWTYDPQGRITSVTDPLGRTTRFEYDSRGNLLRRINALGVVEVENAYDAAGNLVATADALGHVTRFEYDAQGRRTARIDALGRRTAYRYDAAGNPVAVTDRNGQTATRAYDGLGLAVARTDPLGRTVRYEYTPAGILVAITDPLGNRRSRDIDATGKTLAVVDAEGNRTRYRYDLKGNLTALTDPLGRVTRMEYDALDRRIRTLRPDGSAETLSYDRVGRIIARTDALGNRWRFAYDAAGRHIRTTDPLGNTVRFEYDAAGNLVRFTDADGRVTRFEYDALNRRTRILYPDGGEERFGYDAAGRMTTRTDALGNTTRLEYDALGRLIRVIDPLGGQTEYRYDPEGRLIARTDALGRTTRFEYDAVGRRTARFHPDGSVERWTYDAAGRIATLTDAEGKVTRRHYDGNGRLLREVFPDGSERRFTYSATGRLLTATNDQGTVAYTYDASDRPTVIENADGSRIEYAYDAAGRRIATTLRTTPAGTPRVTRYGYDAAGRLVSVTDPDGEVTHYDYDAAGNLVRVQRPNGVTTTFSHDAAGRMTGQTLVRGATVIERYVYAYDARGDLLSMSRLDGTRTLYEYDALRRLTREVLEPPGAAPVREITYAYDAVGNRVRKTVTEDGATIDIRYEFDPGDRLVRERVTVTTAAGSRSSEVDYAYDARGRLYARDDGAETIFYTYGPRDRLLGVTGAATPVAYAYDALGQRIGRITPAAATAYSPDPFNPTGYVQVLAEHDGSGALSAYHTWGLGLVSRLAGGDKRYLHRDAARNVRLLTDAAGQVTDAYEYEAYGPSVSATGVTSNPYRFAGERLDPLTGLVHLRAREYDPRTGRFLSPDPYEGRLREPLTLHPYLYANANPLRYGDPSGLFSIVELQVSMSTVADLAKNYTSMLGNTFIAVRKNIRTYISLGAAGYNMAINLMSAGIVTPSIIELANHSRRLMAQGFEAIRDTIGSQLNDFFLDLLPEIESPFLDLVSMDTGALFSAGLSGLADQAADSNPQLGDLIDLVSEFNDLVGDVSLMTRLVFEDRQVVSESLQLRVNGEMAVIATRINDLLEKGRNR